MCFGHFMRTMYGALAQGLANRSHGVVACKGGSLTLLVLALLLLRECGTGDSGDDASTHRRQRRRSSLSTQTVLIKGLFTDRERLMGGEFH